MSAVAADLLDRIRAVALDEFAERGYHAATLASIAARAGTSKQNVLYHFGSKQTVLAAALEPLLAAIDRFDAEFAAGRVGDPARAAVDLLLEHDRAIGLVLFHFAGLPDHTVAERAMQVFDRIAGEIVPDDPLGSMRFTVAMSGFAYVTVAKGIDRGRGVGREALSAALDDPDTAAELLRGMLGLAAPARLEKETV